jgi:hypothetical protein
MFDDPHQQAAISTATTQCSPLAIAANISIGVPRIVHKDNGRFEQPSSHHAWLPPSHEGDDEVLSGIMMSP